jgi:hypothetical protein
MLFAFVPTSVSKRANAGSARVVEPVPVRDPPATPAVVAGTDELVLVRAVSSLPPESLNAMISQPLERGNSTGCVGAAAGTSAARDCKLAPAVLPGGGAKPI